MAESCSSVRCAAFLAFTEDHKIICVAHKSVSALFEFPVALVQHNVSQQAGLMVRPCGTPSGLSSNIPPDHALLLSGICGSARSPVRPIIVSDRIWMSLLWLTVSKYFSKSISTTYRVALCDVGLAFLQCVMRTAFRSETKAVVRELSPRRLVSGYLADCLLDQPVHDGWYSQFSGFPVLFGYFYPPHGLGRYFPSRRACTSSFRFSFKEGQKFIHLHTVDSACTLVPLDLA